MNMTSRMVHSNNTTDPPMMAETEHTVYDHHHWPTDDGWNRTHSLWSTPLTHRWWLKQNTLFMITTTDPPMMVETEHTVYDHHHWPTDDGWNRTHSLWSTPLTHWWLKQNNYQYHWPTNDGWNKTVYYPYHWPTNVGWNKTVYYQYHWSTYNGSCNQFTATM